ncbi:endonuclease V [Pseudonocardia nigra]|uniref:endonuclease V n=1 Tax=Pseudonocardia nigra TaxID=1921578 RepID=UPI001C5F1149|nr:endonuclease V [Pseudonocardia nigra]
MLDEDEAVRQQLALAGRVRIPDGPVEPPRTIAGLDVSYAVGSDRLVAAAVVVDATGGVVLDEVVLPGAATVAYRPGLLAFREVPPLLAALNRLQVQPDLLLADGHGVAHPRRCGLACHLGVETGLPAVGCAKSHFVGTYDEPGCRRGDRAPLRDAGERVGTVLRTRDRVRPLYVSAGHRIGHDQAADIVLAACSAYRLPDPIRRADHLSRRALLRMP